MKGTSLLRVSKKSETSSTSEETNGFVRGYWKQRLQIVGFRGSFGDRELELREKERVARMFERKCEQLGEFK